ncbi:MAG: hypothetical protein VCE12_19210 [Candidatus Latescibacterota bacterium]
MTVALTGPESPLEGLRAWLQGVVLMCRDEPVCRGCLAMNTAVELGAHDTVVRSLLQRHHARASKILTETISSGQQAGQIRSTSPPTSWPRRSSSSPPAFSAFKVLADTIDAEEMVESALALVAPG